MANFLRNNTVTGDATVTNYVPDDELLIKKDDIAKESMSDSIDDFDIRLLPGIHAAANDPQFTDFGIIHLQKLRRFILKLMGIMLRRQRNISNSDHLVPPAWSPAIRPELHAHCKL